MSERIPAWDRLDDVLLAALKAHARSSFQVVITLASTRQTNWQDACEAYPSIFDEIARSELQRIENVRTRQARPAQTRAGGQPWQRR